MYTLATLVKCEYIGLLFDVALESLMYSASFLVHGLFSGLLAEFSLFFALAKLVGHLMRRLRRMILLSLQGSI